MKTTRVFLAVAVAAVLLSAGRTPLAAQTSIVRRDATLDPTIQRIWRLGQDSSHVMQLSQVLFDSLGPRLMGTPDLKRAQDWLVSMYKSWGVDAKEEQYGTWRGWRRGASHVDLIAPRLRTLAATMTGYSPGTGGRDVTADVIVLPKFSDSASFARWLPQAKDKLVLVDMPHSTCRPAADWTDNSTPWALANKDSIDAVTAAEWGGGRGGDPGLVAATARVRGGVGSAADSAKVDAAAAAGGAGGGRGGRGAGGGGGGGRGAGPTPAQIADSLLKQAMSKGDMTARQNVLTMMTGRGGGVRGTGLSLALGGGALGMYLEGAGAAGILTSRPKDAWGTREIFETYNTIKPTLTLDCEDYGLVYRLADHNQHPRIKMNLDAQLLGEQPVFNVIATMKGTQLPNEYVMMSAHFDSWDGSSGATDNGTGTMTMMEAMRILKIVLPNPKRTILVGHWSGEEEGEVGSKAFVEDHPDVMKNLMGLFNQDNGTGRVTRVSGSGWPDAANHLLAWHDKLPKEFQAQAPFYGGGGQNTIGQGGGSSDNAPFACFGAPTFGLGALGWDYNAYTWHTERDTYDKVIFDDLKGNATLTAMLVYLASEDPQPVKRDAAIALVTRTPPPAPDNGAGAGGGRGGRGNGGGRGAGAGGRGAAAGGGRGAAGAGRAGAGGEAAAPPAPAPPRTIADCAKAPRTTNPRIR